MWLILCGWHVIFIIFFPCFFREKEKTENTGALFAALNFYDDMKKQEESNRASNNKFIDSVVQDHGKWEEMLLFLDFVRVVVHIFDRLGWVGKNSVYILI